MDINSEFQMGFEKFKNVWNYIQVLTEPKTAEKMENFE